MANILARLYLACALLTPLVVSAQQAAAPPPAHPCVAQGGRIDEQRFVTLGGNEQWITIKGASCAKPVILFLHGGPGKPLSPFADQVYGAWQTQFTLVQWDQRGAGRTFGRNPATASATLTVARMAQDGLELAAWLSARLGQRKIILMGGSWGTVLGVHMAQARPGLFHAYVGAAQLVSYRENLSASYRRVIELARAAGDSKTVTTLEALGPPPWSDPRNIGILRGAARTYEAKTAVPAPASWGVPAPLYATTKDRADYAAGANYTELQFYGRKGQGMFSTIDLYQLGTAFAVPVFLLQGANDLTTVPEVARRYFDRVNAPQKDFVLVGATAHDLNAAMVGAQLRMLQQRVLPLTGAQ
jgi:pimeloyl-ACP methyl ester carboxylesterase